MASTLFAQLSNIERPADEIPQVLLYWLAHILGHGDIFYNRQTPSEATRIYVHGLFERFEVKEVIKLLSFIDAEALIGRGTVGQSVEAIVFVLVSCWRLLRHIINTGEQDLFIRGCAALILAMNEGAAALKDIASLTDVGSWYVGDHSSCARIWRYQPLR